MRAMKVRYSIDALLHIAAIHTYINERNPVAATRVIVRIRIAAEQLGKTLVWDMWARHLERENGSSRAYGS